jgi:hypothetical protein
MKNEYIGRWRSVEMEEGNQDFRDMGVPSYMLFEENDSGD